MTLRTERLPDVPVPTIVCDPGILAGYLEDASGIPPGHARGLVRIENEAEGAALLRATLEARIPILCQAARTSLTGGAVPQGELVVSVEKLDAIGPLRLSGGRARVTVGAGVRLDRLRRELAAHGYYYPPVPTYEQAMIGGTVATNAGGAATFKYGATRQWIRGLQVLLFNGERLVLEREQVTVPRGAAFEIRSPQSGTLRVPTPIHRLPALKKITAGYASGDPLDLVDLFVGSEGTLGLITSVTLDLVPLPAAVVTGLAFAADERVALSLSAALRGARCEHGENDSSGPDVRAIEFIDARGLRLLRESGTASGLRVQIPAAAQAALLFEVELPQALSDAEAQAVLSTLLDGAEPVAAGGLTRLFSLLAEHGALDDLEFAFPQDERRQAVLKEFREAVPREVSELLSRRRETQPGVKKVGGDLIVPFSALPELFAAQREQFGSRGLDYAVWGHLADGNLHPNVLARDVREVEAGREALVALADRAIALGGAPLSEHGVGRDPLKQWLLRRFVGDEALAAMLRTKMALDPPGRFAPGTIFPAPSR